MRKLYTTSIFLFFFGLFSSWNSFGQTVSITNSEFPEGTTMNFGITLSAASNVNTVINLSTSNGTASANFDYLLSTPTITIPAGQTSVFVNILIMDDNIDEPNETFTLNGIVTTNNTTNTSFSATGTILDNDPAPTLTINNVTTVEGNSAVFTISLSNPSSVPTVFVLVTTTGTASVSDYTTISTTITIPAGQTSTSINVPTINDLLDEPDENFTLIASVNSGNTVNSNASGTGTIIDNDSAPTLTINNVTVTEGQNATFTIMLSNPSSVDTILYLSTANGTAVAPSDYTTLTTTVTIPSGSTSIAVTISTIADVLTVTEPTETFTLNGVVISTNTSNTGATGTGTIIESTQGNNSLVANDDYFTLSGNTLSGNVLINDINPSGGILTVIAQNLSNSQGTFVISSIGTFTFTPIQGFTGTATFSYTVCDNGTQISCAVANVVISSNTQSGINAVSETIQMNCTGSASGSIVSVIANDTLNGVPVTLGANGNVILTSNISPSSGITIDSLTGVVSIAPNMPAGSLPISYTICEIANPNNCDTVTSSLIISACIIDAVPDTFPAQSGTTTPSVLINDTLNGIPVLSNQVTLTGFPVPAGITQNPDGTISIASNTPSGNYPITYTICEVTNPSNCDTVTSIINVTSNFGITLTGTYSDYNNDGFTNVGDVINYQVTVSNSGSQPITNITYGQGNATINGGPIASLAGGATDTTTFTGVYVLTQNNINSGVVSIDACFYADNSISQCGTTNTTLNLSNGIRLNAFMDYNSNGIQNSGEPNISSGNFNYTINGGVINNVISSNGVLYLYESNPTTVYNLSYVISGNYSCSTTYSNVTVAAGSGITTYNFPVTVTPYTDLAVNIYPWSLPRPGFSYYTQVYYRNNGNQTIASGTITFTKDNALTITSVSPLASTTTATGFTYNFTNLLPYESRTIFVNHSVPTIPTVSLGQMVTSSVVTSIPAGDGNTANNASTYSQPIIGSYDPNDKSESHGGKILHSTFTSNDYLTYTINFENTGTAEAINIRVNDILDAKLDETSIKMVAASSGYTLQRMGSTLTWKFDGINLPPSNGSATVGHGQIVFQIKPKAGYAVGDIIPNTANIYFDFNPAIVTNTCNTQFVNSLSNSNFTFNDFKVYPNPTKNNLTISNEFAIDEVEISSILGQIMITKKVNDLQTTIDTSELSSGIYFVKVSSQENEKTVKIVKE